MIASYSFNLSDNDGGDEKIISVTIDSVLESLPEPFWSRPLETAALLWRCPIPVVAVSVFDKSSKTVATTMTDLSSDTLLHEVAPEEMVFQTNKKARLLQLQ